MAEPPGFSFVRTVVSGEFGVRATVGQQWIGDKLGVINGDVADLASSVVANAKTLERAVHIVERDLDGDDALVIEVGHDIKLTLESTPII